MTTPYKPTNTKAWAALAAHAEEMKKFNLRDAFARDPRRADSMSLEVEGLFLDYSKT